MTGLGWIGTTLGTLNHLNYLMQKFTTRDKKFLENDVLLRTVLRIELNLDKVQSFRDWLDCVKIDLLG